LIEKYPGEKIRFWRTIQKNEIDFVIDEKEALGAKFNSKQFKEKKIQNFSEKLSGNRHIFCFFRQE